MIHLTRAITTTLLIAVLACLSACGGGDAPEPPDYPDNAVRLQQDVPLDAGPYTLVATNIADDKGVVVVELPEGGNEKSPVKKGTTVTSGDLSFEVLGIEASGSGAIVILPATS